MASVAVPSDLVAAAAAYVGQGANSQQLRSFMAEQGHPMSGEWCGEFAAAVVNSVGGSPVKNPAWADNWKTFGTQVDPSKLKPGDSGVITFGNHVGLFSVDPSGKVKEVGGNQRLTDAKGNYLPPTNQEGYKTPWAHGVTSADSSKFASMGKGDVAYHLLNPSGAIAPHDKVMTAAASGVPPSLDARGKAMVSGLKGVSYSRITQAQRMSAEALAGAATAFGHKMTVQQARDFQNLTAGMTQAQYNKLQAGNLPWPEATPGMQHAATAMYGTKARATWGLVNDAFAGRKSPAALASGGQAASKSRGLAPNIGASYSQLRGLGFNPQAARGIVANQMRETLMGDIRPTAKGAAGEFGAFQLRGDKLSSFNTWAAANKLNPNDLGTQNKWFASQPGMVNKLNGLKSPDDTARALVSWENPANKTQDISKNLAYDKQLAANDVPADGETFNRPTDHVNNIDPTHKSMVDGRLASRMPWINGSWTDTKRAGAVMAVQAQNGIKADGKMTPATWQALDSIHNRPEMQALGGYPIGATPAPGQSPFAPVGHDANGHALHHPGLPMSTDTAATIAGGLKPRLRPSPPPVMPNPMPDPLMGSSLSAGMPTPRPRPSLAGIPPNATWGGSPPPTSNQFGPYLSGLGAKPSAPSLAGISPSMRMGNAGAPPAAPPSMVRPGPPPALGGGTPPPRPTLARMPVPADYLRSAATTGAVFSPDPSRSGGAGAPSVAHPTPAPSISAQPVQQAAAARQAAQTAMGTTGGGIGGGFHSIAYGLDPNSPSQGGWAGVGGTTF